MSAVTESQGSIELSSANLGRSNETAATLKSSNSNLPNKASPDMKPSHIMGAYKNYIAVKDEKHRYSCGGTSTMHGQSTASEMDGMVTLDSAAHPHDIENRNSIPSGA
jgi:hypothetical protein